MNQVVVTDTAGILAPFEDGCLQLEEATHYEVTVRDQTPETSAWLDTLPLNPSLYGGFSLWTEHMVGYSVIRIGSEDGITRLFPVNIQPRSEKLSGAAWLADVLLLSSIQFSGGIMPVMEQRAGLFPGNDDRTSS